MTSIKQFLLLPTAVGVGCVDVGTPLRRTAGRRNCWGKLEAAKTGHRKRERTRYKEWRKGGSWSI